MASISAYTSTSVAMTGLVQKPSIARPVLPILGLGTMRKGGRVTCSMKGKAAVVVEESDGKLGMGASSVMAAGLAAAMSSPVAMALVDDRMSTEGTGLAFGLSNNLLGWIIFGVFGLIWALYFTYTSGLEEDEESGLSL